MKAGIKEFITWFAIGFGITWVIGAGISFGWYTGKLVLMILVITSYSIHYTKLYDYPDMDEGVYKGKGEFLSPGFSVSVGFKNFMRLFSDSKIAGPFLKVFIWTFVWALRITSYNVCYTKLLRSSWGFLFNPQRLYSCHWKIKLRCTFFETRSRSFLSGRRGR